MTGPRPALLRVEKGEPDLLELAALAAVLRRALDPPDPVDRAPRRAGWRRPERAPGSAGAGGWRN